MLKHTHAPFCGLWVALRVQLELMSSCHFPHKLQFSEVYNLGLLLCRGLKLNVSFPSCVIQSKISKTWLPEGISPPFKHPWCSVLTWAIPGLLPVGIWLKYLWKGVKRSLAHNKTTLSAGAGAQLPPSVIPVPRAKSWGFVPVIPVTPDENQQKCTNIEQGQR